jgi:hypothetical protein
LSSLRLRPGLPQGEQASDQKYRDRKTREWRKVQGYRYYCRNPSCSFKTFTDYPEDLHLYSEWTVEMMLEDPDFQGCGNYQQQVSGIVSGADRMHGAVNSMLDMVRIFVKFYQIERAIFHSSGKTKFKGGGAGAGPGHRPGDRGHPQLPHLGGEPRPRRDGLSGRPVPRALAPATKEGNVAGFLSA